MKRGVWLRILVIGIVAVFFGLIALPVSSEETVLGNFNLPQNGLWTWMKSKKVQLGLDLQGGTELKYRIDMSKVDPLDEQPIVQGILNVIEKRVNALGVSEAVIQSSKIGDSHYVIVELPGIKNIDEAIQRVGKTVQLEFKEQRDSLTPEELQEVTAFNDEKKKRAEELLKQLNEGADFRKLAEQHSEGENIAEGGETEYLFEDQMDPVLSKAVFEAAGNGFIPEIIETPDGFFLVNVMDRKEIDREIQHEASLNSSHILITYVGSTGADATMTRTKEEAQQLATEILVKAKAGEDFTALVEQFSDDPSKATNKGDLGTVPKGTFVPEYEDAAYAANSGDIVGPAESQFGFHIIKVTEKTDASTETVKAKQAKLAELVLEKKPTMPKDGWADTGLTGEQFKHAAAQPDQQFNYMVSIQFNDEGKDLFAEITRRNLGKPVAIFLDEQLISAPTVQAEITTGEAVISGSFTAKEAADLARDLNTGSIPAPVTLVGQANVGATLGQDALNKGIFAGMIGVIILAFFMIAYYRLPGVMAVLALLVYAATVVALIKLFSITLTLAGIAGVILSIGMAVDANVLIFERLKEELRAGKSVGVAVETGFKRAWSSIRDSNVSSLITCAILFYFGTGIIRGFAVTLALGIIVSMVTAISVSRTFLQALIGSGLSKKPFLWGLKASDMGAGPDYATTESGSRAERRRS